jgi:hypothetical protein
MKTNDQTTIKAIRNGLQAKAETRFTNGSTLEVYWIESLGKYALVHTHLDQPVFEGDQAFVTAIATARKLDLIKQTAMIASKALVLSGLEQPEPFNYEQDFA